MTNLVKGMENITLHTILEVDESSDQAAQLAEAKKLADYVKLSTVATSVRMGNGHFLTFNPSTPDLSAGCIILREDKVLLVLNKLSNKWGFPKGHADAADKFLYRTALRELKEETGVTLEKGNLSKGCIKRNNTYYFVVVVGKDFTFPGEGKTSSSSLLEEDESVLHLGESLLLDGEDSKTSTSGKSLLDRDNDEIETVAWFCLEEMRSLPITHHLRTILLPELVVKRESPKSKKEKSLIMPFNVFAQTVS
jgi:8-oxo-dGTP pyrophosphatase MutT (NUDIX family)